jgi:predicted HicB family RNase H-like nuclease
MPESKQSGSLNLRNIPYAVIQRAKFAALREGKTLRQWILDAVVEKLRSK